MLKRSQCSVFFDETRLVVVVSRTGWFTWHLFLDHECENAEIGLRVLQAWDLYEDRDPDSISQEERSASEAPLCSLFGVDWMMRVRHVVPIRGRTNVRVVPSEWKAENRERLGDQAIELPLEPDADALGAAIRAAMARTLS